MPQLKVVLWQLESDACEGNDVVWWIQKKIRMEKIMGGEERDNIVCCS